MFGQGTMIANFADHSANERTFLAWLRTGLSAMAFGLFVEKLNLLAAELPVSGPAAAHGPLSALVASFGRYDGLAMTVIGVAITLLGGIRFLRNARDIDRPETRAAGGPRIEMFLSGALAFVAAAFCVHMAVL